MSIVRRTRIVVLVSSTLLASAISFGVAHADPVFTASLHIGESGPQVQALQVFLNDQGFLLALAGPGSTGNETDYFGVRLESALLHFQAANSLPTTGTFGPLTRALANALLDVPHSNDASASSMTADSTSTASIASTAAWYALFNKNAPGPGWTPGYGEGGGTATVSNAAAYAYTVSGTASNIEGAVVLENNGRDDLSVSTDGSFSFATALANAANYLVTVFSQPATGSCSLSNASGSISGSNVTNVSLNCLTYPLLGAFANLSKNYSDAAFALTDPTSDSSGTFSYTSSDPVAASISGNTVSPHGAGTVTITATQAADGVYTSTSTSCTLTIAGECELLDPCDNGGTCADATSTPGGPLDSFSCMCPAHYSGDTCQASDLACDADSGNSCLNGGTCEPDINGGTCGCTACYSGSRCQTFNLSCA